MPHIEIEIDGESRKIQGTRTGLKEEFSFRFCLDKNLLTSSFIGAEIFDHSDDVVALQFAYTVFPLIRILPSQLGLARVLVISDLDLKDLGNNIWSARATYTFEFNDGIGREEPEGDTLPYVRLQFSIGGGSKKIMQSLSVKSAELRIGSALAGVPLLNNVIGRTEDSIEGTEVPNTEFLISITGYYLPDSIDFAFMNELAEVQNGKRLTGSYNDDVYLGAQSGEVQLRNVSGGGTVVDIIPITFDFSIQKNVTGEADPGFPDLTMLGHDTLDYGIAHVFDDQSKKMLATPDWRIVHQTATPEDYTRLKLPV